MNKKIKIGVLMTVGSVLTAAVVECLKHRPISIEIVKHRINDDLPIAKFQRLCKEAKEHIAKNGDVPHPDPDVQTLIDMDDDTFDTVCKSLKRENGEWIAENGEGIHTVYTLKFAPSTRPKNYDVARLSSNKAILDNLRCDIAEKCENSAELINNLLNNSNVDEISDTADELFDKMASAWDDISEYIERLENEYADDPCCCDYDNHDCTCCLENCFGRHPVIIHSSKPASAIVHHESVIYGIAIDVNETIMRFCKGNNEKISEARIINLIESDIIALTENEKDSPEYVLSIQHNYPIFVPTAATIDYLDSYPMLRTSVYRIVKVDTENSIIENTDTLIDYNSFKQLIKDNFTSADFDEFVTINKGVFCYDSSNNVTSPSDENIDDFDCNFDDFDEDFLSSLNNVFSDTDESASDDETKSDKYEVASEQTKSKPKRKNKK